MQADTLGGSKETSVKQEAEYITNGLISLQFYALDIIISIL